MLSISIYLQTCGYLAHLNETYISGKKQASTRGKARFFANAFGAVINSKLRAPMILLAVRRGHFVRNTANSACNSGRMWNVYHTVHHGA